MPKCNNAWLTRGKLQTRTRKHNFRRTGCRGGQRVILRVKFRAIAVYRRITALVAQWIEHPPPKGRVTRSIRVEGTIEVLMDFGRDKLNVSHRKIAIFCSYFYVWFSILWLIRFLQDTTQPKIYLLLSR